MGNNHSKTIEVGRKLEDAIRFGVERVEFDGDVSTSLDKVRPEIEKIDHSIFWTTERSVDPFSGTLTESQYQYPESSILSRNAIKTMNYQSNDRLKTVVIIKPVGQLKPVKKINWDAVVEGKSGDVSMEQPKRNISS